MGLSEAITRRSRLAKIASLLSSLAWRWRLPSMATFLFKGAMLMGMLLAISGAASPWGGESWSQIESRPSSFLAAARDGVRSIMKRATGDEENNEKKKKMGNSKSKKGRGK